MFDKIRKGEDGTLGTEIRLSDETPLDGTNVIFYLVNSVTGEVSNPKTVNYKLDKNNPNNINKTSPDLNNYDRNSDSTYTIEFSASDDISGIAKIIWYVITSYSIHYTKLYEKIDWDKWAPNGGRVPGTIQEVV